MQIVIKGTNGKYLNVFTKKEARVKFDKLKREMDSYVIYFLPIAFLFSPALFLILVFFLYRKYSDFNKLFFSNEDKKKYYSTILRPQLSPEVYSIPGYEIYPEDLDKHLEIIKTDNNAELAKKAKRMKKIPYRQIGFNIDILTRHFAFLGTTGAGKTETLMSFFTDVISNGGGVLMVDGKADAAMEAKIYRLCEEQGYETQFNAIILNEPEKRPETNTYSPFLTFTPFKLKMFISDLLDAISGGGGDGNGDYFKNRGKVMLNNEIDYYKIRYDYYNESFTVSELGASTNSLEYTNIYYMTFGMMIDLERKIRSIKNAKLQKYLELAKKVKVPKYDYFKFTETLSEYINQNSQVAKEIEALVGVNLNYMQNLLSLFMSIDEYLAGIHTTWWRYAQAIGYAIYAKLKKSGKNYLYTDTNILNMGDIRLAYQEIKQKEISSKDLIGINKENPIFKDEVCSGFFNSYKEGVGLSEAEETIEKLNNDAMQQHLYADQQWTTMFNMFKQYSHIFATPFPEVDGDDIITNNKVLYVMLPVLEYGSNEVKFLAKIFVLMVKAITATALGAEKQDAFGIQFQIYQNKIKPRPVFICVFDEWGSYATDGMSVILAQARSLLISVIISTQDKVSFKSTEEELLRAMGNLSKIILQVKDTETMDLIEKYIPEYRFLNAKEYQKDINNSNDLVASPTDLAIEKEKSFDVKKTMEFGKGLGLLVVNDGMPVIMQSYYVGGDASKIYIKRYEGFKEYLKKF